MACGCSKNKKSSSDKPCGCKDCGPFRIDGRGRFHPMADDDWGVPAGLRFDAERYPQRDLPMGARLETPWQGGEAPDGRDRRLDRRQELPLGARPSVADRAAVNFGAIDRPEPVTPDVYGMLPLGLIPGRVFGLGAPGTNGGLQYHTDPAALVSEGALQQYIPPLPAPQQACVVNGFDPSWGPPPSEYMGMRMTFDPELGAYIPPTPDQAGPDDEEQWRPQILSRYQSGLMLQPYRDGGGDSGGWRYRWIAQRRQVSCSGG